MFERTTAERISEFCAIAYGVDRFSRQFAPAQEFFLKEVMGINEEQLKNPDNVKALSKAFMSMAVRTVDQITKTEIYAEQDIEDTLARLPMTQHGVACVLRKLALRCGAREPAISGMGQ